MSPYTLLLISAIYIYIYIYTLAEGNNYQTKSIKGRTSAGRSPGTSKPGQKSEWFSFGRTSGSSRASDRTTLCHPGDTGNLVVKGSIKVILALLKGKQMLPNSRVARITGLLLRNLS